MPSTIPPVGKSGPFTISKIVSNLQDGESILFIVASIISPKLWGGIFVAYPAEIPFAPFTSKLGNFAGSTVGSKKRSSKLRAQDTVSLSKSFKSSLLILASLASV